MVGMTKENCKGYTRREILEATEYHAGLSVVDNPSTGDCIHMVCYGLIRNCPINPQKVTIANTTFGLDIATLKGKTTSNSSDPVVTGYVEIPQQILDLNKEATLAADVMFVNGIGLFVSTSR